MEQIGRNRRQPLANAHRAHPLDYLLSSAIACIHLRRMLHGKEGVDGSSPSEGSMIPAKRGSCCLD